MNQLTQIAAFQAVLENYQLSDAAKHALEDIRLVLLVGPSSSGRNTIINQLVQSGPYHYVVSDTTRQPRVNNGVLEQNGKEYWFRTEDEVLADLQAGKFLEAAIIHSQQVSGISVRELQAAAADQKIAINEVEVVGADHIHTISPRTMCLFVLPPSFDEWITRMNARGSLPADEIKRRLESAIAEITTALERDYYQFVVNDTFAHTARRIDAIIRENARDAESQSAAKAVAAELLVETKAHLADLG
jgi:guanylate kinase